MRIWTLLGAGVGTIGLALATPAAAQTGDAEFDGLYVGASIGYSAKGNSGEIVVFDTNRDGVYNDVVLTPEGANAFSPGFCNGAARGVTPIEGCDNGRNGIEYHARVGFDKQFGNFVFGALGEFGRSEVSDSVSAYSTTPANYVFTREMNWNAALRGRAGVAFDRALAYATGGVALARLDREFRTSNTANSFAQFEDGRNVWGWQAGGGIEGKLGDSFSLGVEYLYNRYNDDDNFVAVGPGTAPPTNPFLLVDPAGSNMARSRDRFDYHSVRLVGGFRF